MYSAGEGDCSRAKQRFQDQRNRIYYDIMQAVTALGKLRKESCKHVGCCCSPQTRWHYVVDLKLFINASWNVVFHGLTWFVMKVVVYFFDQWFCF